MERLTGLTSLGRHLPLAEKYSRGLRAVNMSGVDGSFAEFPLLCFKIKGETGAQEERRNGTQSAGRGLLG